jgi:hypothetical protein
MAEIHKIDLGFRPRQWQADCFLGLKRFSVLVVHRRGGKTVMAVMRIIDAALRTQRTDARYAYIAPLFKQAKDVAWGYLTRYARMIPGSKINESETWVQLGNGARIRIYGADNPDSLRGIYLDGVVLDEVAQMRSEVWDEIVLPTLSDRQGWALFIGTPKGVNRFSELYDTARGRAEDWFAALYDVYQTDALPASEVAIARAEMSESSFRQEYLCDFAAANENTLIPLSMAQDCRGRFLREDAYRFAAKIIGVDVARQAAEGAEGRGRDAGRIGGRCRADGLGRRRDLRRRLRRLRCGRCRPAEAASVQRAGSPVRREAGRSAVREQARGDVLGRP